MHRHVRGYSLVELLVAVSIIAALVALVTIGYRSFTQRIDLQTVSQQVIGTLDNARQRTVGSEADIQYGVHFESDRYVEFAGSTYNASDPDNVVHQLSNRFEITNITLTGGGVDVVFDRITGNTATDGTLDVQLTGNSSSARTITILPLGQADIQKTVTPTDTRLTDTRHVHLDFGWSMQGSTTMTLVFSDTSPVTQDIPIADFMNADQTEFDWDGVVDVNGSEQRLRIHTHTLTVADTTLSINRDARFNDKAVAISIDGNDIISYAADNTATPGSSGGTMTVL